MHSPMLLGVEMTSTGYTGKHGGRAALKRNGGVTRGVVKSIS